MLDKILSEAYIALAFLASLALVLAAIAGELLVAGDARAPALALSCTAVVALIYAVLKLSTPSASERERKLSTTVGAWLALVHSALALTSLTIFQVALSGHDISALMLPLVPTVLLALARAVAPAIQRKREELESSPQQLSSSERARKSSSSPLLRAVAAAAATTALLVLASYATQLAYLERARSLSAISKFAASASRMAALLGIALAAIEVSGLAALKSSFHYVSLSTYERGLISN